MTQATCETILQEMASRFQTRGYPQDLLDQHKSTVDGLDRHTLLQPTNMREKPGRITCVTTYNTKSPQIRKVIRKHWHILRKGHPTLFNTPPWIAYCKSLKDRLVRADIGPRHTSVQQTIFGSQNPGTFPCLQCAQCNSVQKGLSFSHPRTGHKFKIPGHFTCNTDHVIYLIKCPCVPWLCWGNYPKN